MTVSLIMTPCIHRGCLHPVDRTHVFSVLTTRAAFLSVLIRLGGPTNHITCLSDFIAASDSITLSCMFRIILPERVETSEPRSLANLSQQRADPFYNLAPLCWAPFTADA